MKRRNSSDSHLRALERQVLAGDLTAVRELARIYERVARGEPPFDIKEQTRRLVDDVERVDGTGALGSIRDVLTELTHIAREHGGSIDRILDDVIGVADEEDQDEEDETQPQRCQGRLGFGPFERRCESVLPCTLHTGSGLMRMRSVTDEENDEDERRPARCRACINGFPLELDACPSCGRTRG